MFIYKQNTTLSVPGSYIQAHFVSTNDEQMSQRLLTMWNKC